MPAFVSDKIKPWPRLRMECRRRGLKLKVVYENDEWLLDVGGISIKSNALFIDDPAEELHKIIIAHDYSKGDT